LVIFELKADAAESDGAETLTLTLAAELAVSIDIKKTEKQNKKYNTLLWPEAISSIEADQLLNSALLIISNSLP